jgi:hypothetical protein
LDKKIFSIVLLTGLIINNSLGAMALIIFASKKNVLLFLRRQLRRKINALSNDASILPCQLNLHCCLPEAPFFTEVAPLPYKFSDRNEKNEREDKFNIIINGKIASPVNVQEEIPTTFEVSQSSSDNFNKTVNYLKETSISTRHTETGEESIFDKNRTSFLIT